MTTCLEKSFHSVFCACLSESLSAFVCVLLSFGFDGGM